MARRRNEVTSKRVASIAGRWTQMLRRVSAQTDIFYRTSTGLLILLGKVGEVKAVSASALTQRPNRRKAAKRGTR